MFLHHHDLLNNASAEIDIKQFSNGYSNLTYLIQTPEKEIVLRRPPFGAVKRGHDMGREFKVLSRLHKAFDKSPKALAFSDDPEILGAPFYIMEKKEGVILNLKEAKKRNVTPEQFGIISDKWLDTYVELHNVDYTSVGLSDLGRPEGYVERQVMNWGKQYLKAATMDIQEAHKIMAWMEENKPAKYDHSLIHNDFKYDNIVFKDDSYENVEAVLDWEMCTLGDPLMDLGTSLGYWTMQSDGPLIMDGIPSPTYLDGNPSRSEVVQRYAEKSGRNIDNLIFYYVYGLFKIAVIAQQIFYRYDKGLATNPKFATLDKSAQFLCMIAWASIQKKKIENLF